MDSELTVSALAGLNFTSFSFENELLSSLGIDDSSSDIGLNLGGMIEFGEGPVGFYADAKIVTGDGGRFEFGGGATFALQIKEHLLSEKMYLLKSPCAVNTGAFFIPSRQRRTAKRLSGFAACRPAFRERAGLSGSRDDGQIGLLTANSIRIF